MNILIAGCGKVGSRLADILSKMGHDVSVVDQNPERFDQLSDSFTGFTIQGVPIDQDALCHAGIEGCDAVAAVTEDDNTNIMVCQIAKEIFHVDKIIARIYDPLREDIFSQFNIKSICPTNLTVSSVYSILTDHQQEKHITINGRVFTFYEQPADPELVGLTIPQLLKHLGPDESLLGILSDTGDVTMLGDSQRILCESDRLMLTNLVD